MNEVNLAALRQLLVERYDDLRQRLARRLGSMEFATEVLHETYLRLGRGEPPGGYVPPPFAPWRRLQTGNGPVVLALGPLAGAALKALRGATVEAELWAVGALPLPSGGPPAAFRSAVAAGRPLIVYEEHVRHGALGSQIADWLLHEGLAVRHYRHLAVQPQAPVERYGSQAWLRRSGGIAPEHLVAAVQEARAA